MSHPLHTVGGEPSAIVTDREANGMGQSFERDRNFGGLSVAETVAEGFTSDINQVQRLLSGQCSAGGLIDGHGALEGVGCRNRLYHGVQNIGEGVPLCRSEIHRGNEVPDFAHDAVHLANCLVKEFRRPFVFLLVHEGFAGFEAEPDRIERLQNTVMQVLADPSPIIDGAA